MGVKPSSFLDVLMQKTFHRESSRASGGSPLRRFIAPLTVLLVLTGLGCIQSPKLTTSKIILASKVYGPGNLTEITNNTLGDDQLVYFYIEARGFKTKRTDRHYEFWVSMDIKIQDDQGNVYVQKIDEKQIHVTNATRRHNMVYYYYPWFTGNLVKSGAYKVTIVVKDQLSDLHVEATREFKVNLTRRP